MGGTRFTGLTEVFSDAGPLQMAICTECGAAIMLTPSSGTAPLDLHDRWHDNIVIGLAQALTRADEAAGRDR